MNAIVGTTFDEAARASSVLNQTLGFAGVSSHVISGPEEAILVISIDEDALDSAKRRNAGRRRKPSPANELEDEELLSLLQTISVEDGMELLDLSRAGYYRRLKQLKSSIPHRKKSSFVKEYLTGWVSPRNEINRANASLKAARDRLRKRKELIYRGR